MAPLAACIPQTTLIFTILISQGLANAEPRKRLYLPSGSVVPVWFRRGSAHRQEPHHVENAFAGRTGVVVPVWLRRGSSHGQYPSYMLDYRNDFTCRTGAWFLYGSDVVPHIDKNHIISTLPSLAEHASWIPHTDTYPPYMLDYRSDSTCRTGAWFLYGSDVVPHTDTYTSSDVQKGRKLNQ